MIRVRQLTYLGFNLNTQRMKIPITKEKICKIKKIINNIMVKNRIKIRDFF